MSDDEYRQAVAELEERSAACAAPSSARWSSSPRRTAASLLLTGDLGYMALEPFSERFPDRFFNVGVAEQNMVGIATGLAEAGFVPFVYSIVTFATLRPYEFIRNGPVWHRLPVRIVGVGGGFEYGPQGCQPPRPRGRGRHARAARHDGHRAGRPPRRWRRALRATWDLPGPVYYRIGKDDRTVVPGLDGRFALGPASRSVRDGRRRRARRHRAASRARRSAAADALAARGVAPRVLVVASVQPAPVDDLRRRARAACRSRVTVEAHYVTGGLGSLVAEVHRRARARLPPRSLRRCARCRDARVGSQR